MGGKTKAKSKNKSKGQQSGPTHSPQHSQGDHGGMGAVLSGGGGAAADDDVTTALKMDCEVCHESFDDGNRKPRNLKCGHGFCTVCCKALVQHHEITCPNCRQKTKLQKSVEELSVNYPVLNMLLGQGSEGAAANQNRKSTPKKIEKTSPHGGRCLEAQAEVTMHCAHCLMWLCKECSRIDHSGPECLLTPFLDTLEEMSQAGMTKVASTQNTLKEFSREAEAYGGKLRSFAALLEIALDCVKREQGHLAGLVDHSQEMNKQICDLGAKNLPGDVEGSLVFLDMLEEATDATQQWAKDATSVFKGEQVFKLSKALMQTSVQMHMTGGIRSSSDVMGLHNIKGVEVTLPVEMDGSRLVVHAAQQQVPGTGCRVMKLYQIKSCIDPSRALTFLDISLRGQELGRVFIRLLGCTKQSLSFLMMCTGEAGPSFRNTRFHRVWLAGKPGESVWAGDHDLGDGGGGTLPSEILQETKDLSNKKTQVAITAGLVAGRYGKINSTIFRIYTMQSSDAFEEAAFGRVEYGLHILKDALNNNKNITELTISGCGMVVEP